MGENVGKQGNPQGINLQNIQTAHAALCSKNNPQSGKKYLQTMQLTRD